MTWPNIYTEESRVNWSSACPRLAGKLLINQKFSQKFTERALDRERKSLLAPGVRDALPLIGVIAPHCSCLANLIILTQIQILTEVRHLPSLPPQVCISVSPVSSLSPTSLLFSPRPRFWLRHLVQADTCYPCLPRLAHSLHASTATTCLPIKIFKTGKVQTQTFKSFISKINVKCQFVRMRWF